VYLAFCEIFFGLKNMILFSLNLPTRLKLSLKVERKRGRPEKPLIPTPGEVMRTKEGNKASFLFRHIFEHKKIRKIVGANIVFLVIISSFLPTYASGTTSSETDNISSPLVMSTEKSLRFPVANVKITQKYTFFHPGIDLDGLTGDAIYPIMAGKVDKVEHSRFAYGKSVVISHGGNTSSLYAHLSKIDVVEGQEVSKETKIGEMGATGRASGDHLHLEIQEDGKTINPLIILQN